MKTKIFLAFIIVILAALLSNFIFEWLIIKDFDNYVNGVKEDQFYWILASVEGSYSNGRWNTKALSESIHWAMMLGLDIKVLNADGHEVISSREVMDSLSDTMKRRMEALFHMHMTEGKYEEYPLYIEGKNIGKLLSRPFEKDVIKEKESVFRMRSKNFILVSFLIAGGGSIIIALFFSRYLSKPLTDLKTAAESIAKGDFNMTITPQTNDEIGRLSETFNIMTESLQREEELRKRLMSNIAHELRTPLTIAKSNIEAIEDRVIKTEKGLENIKGEINRLIRLIKGIEDITTAEASFFARGETAEVNLKEFLSELSEELRPAFKEKRLGITITKEDELIVFADIEKLEKIIRNIISNSLKFTEKGGVWIGYGTEESDFYIEIRDSGRGIPENEMPLIFNRFYRIEGSRTDGLGLGLAIVKELVNVMGGRIEVESKVNEGTTFRIYLPRGA
ncbi:MAG: HAMP domain-containing sensor histidine kinase [Thermodesulfovibrionales bacterium]|jgi:signal transduction histidine kinase|nr:HAMP domain-containing sensor histidine kinase [Thermodesulfovibrionales bacterium]